MKKIFSIIIALFIGLHTINSHASDAPLDISVIYGGIHDNKVVVFFNIKSPEGTKTYWQNPGFGGISPEFAFDKTLNIKDVAILYNIPKVTTKSGITNYTLKHNDYIAVSFIPQDPAAPINLKGTLTYGYCDVLCKSDKFQFDETFNIEQPSNKPLIKKFFASMPKPITPDMALSINTVTALYNQQKNLLISFKIDGLTMLEENKLIYYIDTDFEINKPIIKNTDANSYQISLDLFNIYKKPKYLTLIFPNNDGKNIISKQKIFYNGKQ